MIAVMEEAETLAMEEGSIAKVDEPVALITGTSSGFGLLTSIALAKDGYHVIATMRNLEKTNALLEMAGKAGVLDHVECMKLDVTSPEDIHKTVENVIAAKGRIDVLVNNAGYAVGGLIEEIPLAKWRQQFDTNVFGALACTQAVLPQMRAQGTGTIVSISSISGQIAMPGLGPYSASKFALEGLMESLRFEVARYGIRVILIEPGPYRTSVWENSLAGYQINPDSPYRAASDKLYRQVLHTAKSAGDPAEVVHVIRTAIADGNKRFRYPVGKGMGIALAAKKWLPWRMFEKMVQSRM